MMIVSDKDLYVSIGNGGACRFKAGVARDVPELLGLEALRRGARQATAEAKEPVPEPKLNSGTPPEEQVEEPAEENDLEAVMAQIVERADPDDLRADGTPKAAVVNKLAGRIVEVDERENAWAEALSKEG